MRYLDLIENIVEKYSVGALLYSPALNQTVADSIIEGKFSAPFSLALCLEDTISDDMTAISEKMIIKTLSRISQEHSIPYLPKIFVRVREPAQIVRLYEGIKDYQDILTGFIFPKYSLDNAEQYNVAIRTVNSLSDKRIYMMPILESSDLISCYGRPELLKSLKDMMDSIREYILNVRVGGNDFSNVLATRRHMDETIYSISAISNLFGDIISVFSEDYVVSGPVWEYFSSENGEWAEGLRAEIKLDRLNGFIGKTVIHPNQLPIANEMFMVTKTDYEDAKVILDWDDSSGLRVGKSVNGDRMNEVRTHFNWAIKIMTLAKIYGVTDEH